MTHSIKNKHGFTLAELLISVTILAIIVVLTFSIYGNFFDSFQRIKASNLVYEEARFLMERIVKEVRNGTIDYEEYFNQSSLRQQFPESYSYLRNETYAQNYCQYNRQFFTPGLDGEIGTFDDQSTGLRSIVDSVDGLTPIPPAVGRFDSFGFDEATPVQKDLFLINVAGDRRTYIKRTEEVDNLGKTIGKIALLKLEGRDFGVDSLDAYDPYLDNVTPPSINCEEDLGEGDGNIDTWQCEDGFPCERVTTTNADGCEGIVHRVVYAPDNPDQSSFVDISPSSLHVEDITFIISPIDDPRKAYNNNEVQIQPHITIRLTASAAPSVSRTFNSSFIPNIVLESTVSARAYNEIVSECNLKQCTPGVSPDLDCPLTAGVCGPNAGTTPAQQSCVDYIWEGCSAATYQTQAQLEWGTDYQEGSEYRSCDDDLIACLGPCVDDTCINNCNTTANTCKTNLCNDTLDNDCSGAADAADAACNLFFCNDGQYDVAIEGPGCTDVGGICNAIRPLEASETQCNDGHDNDCDGFADQFDADCVVQYCSNGQLDAGGGVATYLNPPFSLFFDRNLATPDYLLDESPGGSDPFLNEEAPDIGGICTLCFDASGEGACECNTPGCTNNPILPDQGSQAPGPETLCYDGLDNDADGDADELDSDCQAVICQDGVQNCDLAPNSYAPPYYLGDYVDSTCDPIPFNVEDESCVDVGGLCNGFIDGGGTDHSYTGGGETACFDGLDNDCDGGIDWADPNGDCCAPIGSPYCLQNSGFTFVDYLDNTDYLSLPINPSINHDTGAGLGELTLSDPNLNAQRVLSGTLPLNVSECPASYNVQLSGTVDNEPPGTDLRFYLSDDGGANWCGNTGCSADFSGDALDTPSELGANVNLSGSTLRWAAEFSGDGVAEIPSLNEIHVTYTCL